MAKVTKLIIVTQVVMILVLFESCGVSASNNRVWIDTLEDLAAIGGVGNCTYINKFQDIATVCQKKARRPINPYPGYWSSCTQSNCEFKIRVGSIRKSGVGSCVLSGIYVFGIVHGPSYNSEIRVGYKLSPGSEFEILIDPIEFMYPDYTFVNIKINSSLGLTANSEIYFRFASSPLEDEVDILDAISFEFSDLEVTPSTTTSTQAPTTTTTTKRTTTRTTATTTTHKPEIPDEVLDIKNVATGWTTNCVYQLMLQYYNPLSCGMNVPADSVTRIGLWSSCGTYCALTYSPSTAGKPSPNSIVIKSFVSGLATIDIWVRVKGVLKHVGTVKDTTWNNVTFSLTQFGLDQNSEILFEPSSTRYPNHVDLIDMITLRFSSTSTPSG